MDKLAACGIEVSARELVVALEGATGQVAVQRFANTLAGQQQLLQTLTRGGSAREGSCLEATGVYGLDVALLLSGHAQLEVVVANPRAVRNFAQSLDAARSKSDPQDAVVLCGICAAHAVPAVGPPEPATLALWAIARRLQALTAQRTAEKKSPARGGGFLPRYRSAYATAWRAVCGRWSAKIKKAARRGVGVHRRGGQAAGTPMRQLRSVPGDRRSQRHSGAGRGADAAGGSRRAPVGGLRRTGSAGISFGNFRAAKRRASAKWVIGTCGGPCICRRW